MALAWDDERKRRNGLRVYGEWAGCPNGCKEDLSRCVEGVFNGFGSMTENQCSRKRGYGRDGLYCKQHAKTNP